MGCVYSQRRHAPKDGPTDGRRIFSVCNVDDSGQEVNFGKIEITDHELCLHQKGRNSIFWSLRSLRRYGFDSELFSFECGRRCQTGPGIYAFKCQQAEALFNALQEAIQASASQAPPPPPHSPPEVQPRGQVPARALPEVHQYMNSPFYVNVQTAAEGGGGGALPGVQRTDVNTNYAKLDDFLRFYVNVKPNQEPSPPASPPACNYITLDLDQSASTAAQSNSNQPIIVQTAPATPIQKTPPADLLAGPSPPQTPTSASPPMSYAQIDFEKTSALSSSALNHRKL